MNFKTSEQVYRLYSWLDNFKAFDRIEKRDFVYLDLSDFFFQFTTDLRRNLLINFNAECFVITKTKVKKSFYFVSLLTMT